MVRRHEGRIGRIASRDSRSEELPRVLLADDGAWDQSLRVGGPSMDPSAFHHMRSTLLAHVHDIRTRDLEAAVIFIFKHVSFLLIFN